MAANLDDAAKSKRKARITRNSKQFDHYVSTINLKKALGDSPNIFDDEKLNKFVIETQIKNINFNIKNYTIVRTDERI